MDSVLVTVFAFLIAVSSAAEFPNPSEPFTHNAVLDANDNFYIFWKFDDVSITFELHVKTKGYIGFGISPNGNMVNSDVIVGWVYNGTAFLQDRHTLGKFEPTIDPQQDWQLISGHETDVFTVLKFQRNIDTCDSLHDIKITDGTTRLIFAWGASEPDTGNSVLYHSTNRGTKSILLLQPSVKTSIQDPSELYSYDIVVSKVSVPQKRTTYWCTAYKMPKLEKKHHLIKYEPVITPGNEGIVHHILVYGCFHPVDDTYHGKGMDCSANPMPGALNGCRTTLLAWAVGGTTYHYPKHVGWPLGVADDPTFLIMETHYDNPQNLQDIVDSSGLRVYYTPILRQYDAGQIELGINVNKAQIVPPGYKRFVNKGYCPGKCTGEGLTNGIQVFSSLPHEHLLGTGVRTRLIRNGEEITLLGEDMSYDFNFQEMRHLKKEVTVLPGDEMLTECYYKSDTRKDITYGGLGTTEEMCLHFLLYYPKSKLSRCLSGPQYTLAPGTPWASKLAGKSVQEIVTKLDWTKEDVRKTFQDVVEQSENGVLCMNANTVLHASGYGYKPIQVTKWLPEPQSNCTTN